jgi:hypothetical protein
MTARTEKSTYWIMESGAMWMLPLTDRAEAEHEIRRLRVEYPHKRWTLEVHHSVVAEVEVAALAGTPSEDTA